MKKIKIKAVPFCEMSGAARSCSDYETSVRGNFVMEREALRAACNNNIQQFLRGFNVAVWETCINPSLLWVSPAWKIEQGSTIKQPAQHGIGKLPTKLVHAASHAARSIHKQLHKNKTSFRAEKKPLTPGSGGAIRWIFKTLIEQDGHETMATADLNRGH